MSKGGCDCPDKLGPRVDVALASGFLNKGGILFRRKKRRAAAREEPVGYSIGLTAYIKSLLHFLKFLLRNCHIPY